MDQKPRPRGSASGLPLSIEASLDEENKEVLANLGQPRSRSPAARAPRGRTPPPYRSMLDVDQPPVRHGSMPGMGVSVTSPRDQRKPSKRLDPGDPSTWTKPVKVTSPTSSQTQVVANDPSGEAPQGLPKIQIDSRSDFEQKYNFDMASIPSIGGGAKPAHDRRPREGSNSGTKSDAGSRKTSMKASPPTGPQTSTPSVAMLSTESLQPKLRTSSGSVPKDEARRRLSNKSSSFSTVADDDDQTPKRVMADDDGDEEAVAESSSEEERRSSSSDEDSPVAERGRRREKDEEEAKEVVSPEEDKASPDERRVAPQSQGVRSLIEPVLSPSAPHEKSGEVHPQASFGRSGPTAADFAPEDDLESDIQKAKNMGISISPLDSSIPDRHVRMIIRGQWSKFQDENENNNSSPRLYLACTDLSTEATYAMEWTVGTMLRDGDTLLAIYAIEDELAPKEPEGNAQVMNESVKAAKDASDAMETLTRQTTGLESKPMTKFVPAIDAPTAAGSIDLKQLSKKEIERIKAIDEITSNFLKLVRKHPYR